MTQFPPVPDAILIQNALRVATFDDALSELAHADVLVVGNRIVQVGIGIPPTRSMRVIDASGMLCLPGFVNCHHHLYQTLTRNVPRVQNAELFEWLTNLYEIWHEVTPELVYISALVGLGELLLTGCTTSTDHLYLFPRNTDGHLIDAEIRAASELGIRFHPTRGCMTRGKSLGGLPPDDLVQKADVIFADCERLVATYHDPAPDAMVKIGVAPCSPFSVTEEIMVELARLARANGLRLHTHMAETADEERYCLETYGMRPFDWAEKVGWLGMDVWFAHVVHVQEDEILRLAATGTGVAHCPASNMRLGSGIAPVPRMLDAGVRVGLGVDGSASNDTGDMWGEIRNTMLLHRVTEGAGALDARTALQLGTRGGADILGYDQLGKIEVGALADIILIDLNKLGFAGAMHDPVTAPIFAGDSHIVEHSFVNGIQVVEHGKLTRVKEHDLIRTANDAAAAMLRAATRRTGQDFLLRPHTVRKRI